MVRANPSVQGVVPDRPLWVELTSSPSRRRMAGICAKRTASVDVKRLSQIPAVDVAVAGKLSFASNYRPHPPSRCSPTAFGWRCESAPCDDLLPTQPQIMLRDGRESSPRHQKRTLTRDTIGIRVHLVRPPANRRSMT
jgi:hypothetical protein